MDYTKIGRYILLGTLVLFSFLVLGISGSLLSAYEGGITPVHLGLDLAMAVITLIVIVPSLVIDFFRKGAFTSMVVVEIGWASVLTIFWVAAAGETSAQLALLPANCNYVLITNSGKQVANVAAQSQCHQEQAVETFSWLNFIIIFGWAVTLIVLTATQHSKGNRSVWKSSVTGVDFRAGKGSSYNQKYQAVTSTPVTVQQQNMGYSQGSPHAGGYNPAVAHV